MGSRNERATDEIRTAHSACGFFLFETGSCYVAQVGLELAPPCPSLLSTCVPRLQVCTMTSCFFFFLLAHAWQASVQLTEPHFSTAVVLFLREQASKSHRRIVRNSGEPAFTWMSFLALVVWRSDPLGVLGKGPEAWYTSGTP